MNRYIIYILLLGLTACRYSSDVADAGSQSRMISIYDSEFELDFGNIPDTVQTLSRQLAIYNDGQDTVRITSIERSCGCTDIELENTIIAPGDSIGFGINVEMGSNYSFFEREVALYTDHNEEPLVIYVKATRQLPKYVIANEFPNKLSESLRLNATYIIAGYIPHGGIRVKDFNILNNSESEASYKVEISGRPPYISINYDETLQPNEIGRIIIAYDLTAVDNIWGIQKNVICVTDTKSNIKTEIPIEAIFVEKLNEKDENAPRILVPATYYTIDTSVKDKVKFTIKNVGNRTLHIRDIQRPNGQEMSIGATEIASKGETILTVNLQHNQEGRRDIGITTDDPMEPYKVLRIDCEPSR